MSPLPSSCSAPLPSRIVRESVFDDTRNEMRDGRLALIRPVMTSTDGPLRREDQVDADGARHLRQPADRFLDLVARHHHQVGQLVDDDDDEGQRLGRLRDPCAAGPPSASALRMLRLYCSMLRTPSAASVL